MIDEYPSICFVTQTNGTVVKKKGGLIHYYKGCDKTLCGKIINDRWYIEEMFDKLGDKYIHEQCGKCKKIYEELK